MEKPKRILERGPVADVWRNVLSKIPSVFGQLVYLASLRDENAGRYEHHGLALNFGADEAHRALRTSHAQVFEQWLSYSLEDQKADLDLYLTDLQQPRKTVIETWLKLSPYRNLVPATIRKVERDLYVEDLHALLSLLRNEYGVADPDRDA